MDRDTPPRSATVAKHLQAAYDDFYTDEQRPWRELGAKYKAQNIIEVCRSHRFETVLDCGAGEGSVLAALDRLRAFRELHAIEISDTGIAKIQGRNLASVKQIQKFDGYTIPYPDRSFDMAYCSHVIEHVEHPRLLLRELRRVSAHQVFEIPLDYSPKVDTAVAHYLAYGHINVFSPATFKFLLKSEGFAIDVELLTHTPNEVARYLYETKKRPRILRGELGLRLQPVKRLLHRLRYGQRVHEETAYAAFTCLSRGTGELKVFTSS